MTSLPVTAARVAGQQDLRGAVVAVDGVLRHATRTGTPGLTQFQTAIEGLPAAAARRRAAAALDLADARSESAGESLSRIGMHLLGYALPELQQEFAIDGRVYRGDFSWPGLIGEFDGRLARVMADHDVTRRVFSRLPEPVRASAPVLVLRNSSPSET